jgi:hypothetical protein
LQITFNFTFDLEYCILILEIKFIGGGIMKKVFIICPVRDATPDVDKMIREYIKELEGKNYEVHYPPRDTNQNDPIGINICTQNMQAVMNADEVHIYWTDYSKGSLFDLGMTFMARKPLKIINRDEVEETDGKKSFNNVLRELDRRYESNKHSGGQGQDSGPPETV